LQKLLIHRSFHVEHRLGLGNRPLRVLTLVPNTLSTSSMTADVHRKEAQRRRSHARKPCSLSNRRGSNRPQPLEDLCGEALERLELEVGRNRRVLHPPRPRHPLLLAFDVAAVPDLRLDLVDLVL